ncbi:MAG TPA: DUF4271 domain-containing protein [Bacteroidales bacterium]|nr:DUF4271 domain-containing protein [Bacteroidales bacterium]
MKNQEKCQKPSDLTLYVTGNSFNQNPLSGIDTQKFPFSFVNLTREYREKKFTALKESLRDGILHENSPLKADWMVPVLLAAAMIYITLAKIPGNIFRGLINFITFKGLKDKYRDDSEKIFRLQSTLMNLASFISIGMFIYMAAGEKMDDLPLPGGIILWLICFALVVAAVTLRHLATVLTGFLSEERDLFSGYLAAVYNFYRISGIISFLLVILVAYGRIFPAGLLITTGYVLFIILIILRLARLVLLFIHRRASVLYLILYLCALEILPVAVLVKYGTGLISGL